MFSHFASLNNKILILFSNGEIIFDKLNTIQGINESNDWNANLETVFDFSKFRVLEFRLLECQTRALFYLKSLSSNTGFDKIALVDLNLEIKGKGLVNAFGQADQKNVSANFDGSVIFSVRSKKKKTNRKKKSVNILLHKLKKTLLKKNKSFEFNTKTLKLQKPNSDLIYKTPTAICFLYKINLLLVAVPSGELFTFDVGLLMTDQINRKQIEIKSHSVLNFFSKKTLDFEQDFFIEILRNWDQRYAFGATSLSKIIIMRVQGNLLEKVRKIEDLGIFRINLSSNGKFLAYCGAFFESISQIDLETLDQESFGKNCENIVSRYRALASPEAVKRGDREDNFFEKMCAYRFGSMQKLMEIDEKKFKFLRMTMTKIERKTQKKKLSYQKFQTSKFDDE